MKMKQFVQLHREDWKQLEHLIRIFHKKKRNVTGAEIEHFHKLYQKTAQHLSYSQTYFKGEDVTFYLNGLVAKAHNLLYRNQVSSLKQIGQFFGTTFVGLFLQQWKFIIVAMLLFSLGMLGSFFTVLQDPLYLYSILPADIAQAVDPEQLGKNHDMINASYMSVTIMLNNIQVAILAFAGGVTFGILTVYVLIYNGIIVGALAALFWHYGMSYQFWAYIVPHGMIELTAIFIAGGAGLLMGYKLFVPGEYSRGYQLKENGKRSVLLLLGTIPLFIIAAFVEGFITPASLPLGAKYAVAFVTVIGLFAYIIVGNRLLTKKQLITTHD
ncbi:stage II sporulation protein M [Alkalihalobacillus sp. LMS39]|uniref:stage II sporulation protein M n=1 Tax=Alkalihalobacillus sp. LMS39 TaxID=2924032 RepID=UPI001FB360F3|nr:stage II sporulation protein M [Alkalihalobacillus sp. LMS39]UOE96174.1 stage II sporulation protein M [Alkalihalobacillus sp. LMS39]